MRTPIIAANWKMHKTSREARAFVEEYTAIPKTASVEVIICPPFTSIETVSTAAVGTGIAVGAQDVYWEPKGAFTGEVSSDMLSAAGCRYCIVGHSERRKMFSEKDADVGLKAGALLAAGLSPIICVGETAEERERGETQNVVGRQLNLAVSGIPFEKAAQLVIAYEPVWAIGSGTPATPEDAIAVTKFIRQCLDDAIGKGAGEIVRIQYGGSVKPENILDFMKTRDIDGALVGGASLEARGFAALVNNAGRV